MSRRKIGAPVAITVVYFMILSVGWWTGGEWPSRVAARHCPDYMELYAVRADNGATCAQVHDVQRALLRSGFSVLTRSESHQFIDAAGGAWHCTWSAWRAPAPAVRCESLEEHAAFRALLAVDD